MFLVSANPILFLPHPNKKDDPHPGFFCRFFPLPPLSSVAFPSWAQTKANQTLIFLPLSHGPVRLAVVTCCGGNNCRLSSSPLPQQKNHVDRRERYVVAGRYGDEITGMSQSIYCYQCPCLSGAVVAAYPECGLVFLLLLLLFPLLFFLFFDIAVNHKWMPTK